MYAKFFQFAYTNEMNLQLNNHFFEFSKGIARRYFEENSGKQQKNFVDKSWLVK